eukprot:scaffold140003_cov160-Phaeocystis_antarctica.AAC.1
MRKRGDASEGAEGKEDLQMILQRVRRVERVTESAEGRKRRHFFTRVHTRAQRPGACPASCRRPA